MEEALKKAEVIITEIENGLSFKEAQKNYSSLFDNDQNGSWVGVQDLKYPLYFKKLLKWKKMKFSDQLKVVRSAS